MPNIETKDEFLAAWKESCGAGGKSREIQAALLQKLPGIPPLLKELTGVDWRLERNEFRAQLTDVDNNRYHDLTDAIRGFAGGVGRKGSAVDMMVYPQGRDPKFFDTLIKHMTQKRLSAAKVYGRERHRAKEEEIRRQVEAELWGPFVKTPAAGRQR